MRIAQFLAHYGPFSDHRIVVTQPDGSFVELDDATLIKVVPRDQLPDGTGPDWNGVLVAGEGEAAQYGERVIAITAVA